MGQALYRKYRSKSLDEIIGQEHITDTLKQAIKSGRISHAYLLTGPRGVGKTSVARILAHEINNLPYTDDSMHIDIIEIDAASNRRIDEIRELRDKVYIAPTSAKYKVYIIDEVHMLTKEAFNALLKTLEEPPAHVVFILATTDSHKLPETIISRTQRFTFKPVDKQDVVKHLKFIAEQESINISDEALEILAEHGEGSFRDSISLFDQASNGNKKIESEDVLELLGIPSMQAITELAQKIKGDSSVGEISRSLTALYDQGFQAVAIAKQLSKLLRSSLINSKPIIDIKQTLELLAKLVDVAASYDPERYLEIVLLSYAADENVTPAIQKLKVEPSESQVEIQPAKHAKTEEPKQVAEKPVEIEQTVKITPPKTTKIFDEKIWSEVLGMLKASHNTLYGIVRMANPRFVSDNELELAFAFPFHQKRINEAKNSQIIADIVHEITGKNIKLSCIVDKNASAPKIQVKSTSAAPKTNNKELTNISNIFGGGELIES